MITLGVEWVVKHNFEFDFVMSSNGVMYVSNGVIFITSNHPSKAFEISLVLQMSC